MNKPTDIWFDLSIGNISTSDNGTIMCKKAGSNYSRLTNFSLIDYADSISDESRKELHNLLDIAIDKIW